MKKILSLIGAISIAGAPLISVIGCSSNNDNLTVDQLREQFKNPNLIINNSWGAFWGDLTQKLNNQTYYQLLIDQMFKQNNVNPKYEKDVAIWNKGTQTQATKLTSFASGSMQSKTNFDLHIAIGLDYTDLPFNVSWTLNQDQKTIYPLVKQLTAKNQAGKRVGDILNIYDGNYQGYPDNKVKIGAYSGLKTDFQTKYGANTYQYTNFTTDLRDVELKTDGSANKLNLKITNNSALFEDNNFTINFNNIAQIFNQLNEFYSKNHVVYWGWNTTNINNKDTQPQFWRALIGSYTSLIRNISALKNFRPEDFTYTDNNGQKTGKELPKPGEPNKVIQIHFKNAIIARVWVGFIR